MRRFLFLIFIAALGNPNLWAFKKVEQKTITPEEAFKASITKKHSNIAVTIKLAENIYLYDKSLKISIIEPKKISIDKEIKRPKPVKYHEFMVYDEDIVINIPLELIYKKVGGEKFKLQVKYRGCSKKGLCYPPMKHTYESVGQRAKEQKSIAKSIGVSEQDEITKTLSKGSLSAILLAFFGFGLLLALTPCVFPMVPILSSIIVSQSDERMNAKKGFLLSVVYVLSMSAAYTLAGIMAGLFGGNIQVALQNPFAIISFSVVFIALAFSMFGYYEIRLPNSIQSKLNKTAEEAKGHGFYSVAVMGFLSALIVGPCVAPPLAGALVYIGQTGDALLGGAALFVMSIGMGMPLLVIGAGAGKFMPKPGGWMDGVSKVFGVVMLGLAVYMLSRILPSGITMALWSFLFLGSAIYMGALEPIKEGVAGIKKMTKVAGIILFIYGIALFVGCLTGASNPLNPLEKFSSCEGRGAYAAELASKSEFKTVKTVAELEKNIASSKRPVIVDFYADWCVSCVELEENTFSNTEVVKALKNYTLLKIDVTKNSEEDKKMLKKFGLFGPPGIVFYDKNGKEVKGSMLIGYKKPDEFLKHLKNLNL